MSAGLLRRLCVVFLIIAMSNLASGATSSMKNIPPDAIAALDRAVAAAIELELTPGAVIVAGHRDGAVFEKAYGHLNYDDDAPPVRLDTIYDLASLSKTIGTATSIMILADLGRLAVTDPVSKYLPGMNTADKKDITIEQCLLHRAGFVADNDIKDYKSGPDAALAKIYSGKLKYKPGTDYEYSDVGFIVLGEVVKAASRQPLDAFAKQNIFQPLGMTDTMYLPPAALRGRIAPTEKRGGQWIIGEVHDPRAYALGGFAGHAGLFATAGDVGRFCRMILKNGALDGRRILSERAVAEMTRPRPLKNKKTGETTVRGYGLDIDTKHTAGPLGKRFERGRTFGHTGYTGTSLWIDPVHDCFVVLLTNRVHPDDELEIKALRRRVSTIVADAFLGPKAD
jgi:CubicO group peptidase (beta-lactamase class C family)